MRSTLILGFGNPLMADDGAGVKVAQMLQQKPLPAGVKVMDGGTAGVGMVPEMEGFQRVVLIDCALMGAQPGVWKRFTLQEAGLLGKEESPLSLHESSLQDALRLADALDVLPPQVIIYGVQPASVEWDQPMCRAVETALPSVAQAVLEELEIGR